MRPADPVERSAMWSALATHYPNRFYSVSTTTTVAKQIVANLIEKE